MSTATTAAGPPEHNITGIDFGQRGHLRYAGPPLLDIHSHVTLTGPGDSAHPAGSLAQAETMLDVATEFHVGRIYTMCPPEHIAPLRERFGARLGFNGSILKHRLDSPDDEAYQLLDHFLAAGIEIVKFWAAPRGRDRGLFVDAPWRVEAAQRAIAAGVRVFMVHVGDPDAWFRTVYADRAKFGTKADQYTGLIRLLTTFPEVNWIGAHMGGDVEHPDYLEALLERFPHLCFDTSATKWQVREVSSRTDAIRSLMCRYPNRFLFGTDLVTRPGLPREHYISRYWCQRTLWESHWTGRSPIADPDFLAEAGGPTTPPLHGIDLPAEVLELVYHGNAERLLAGR
ncbi:MAG: amidohydrolase family protein [Planctomycetia bacterium]|nr:amidohydrolase family protein [Planctomycetia bacterium]